MVSVPPMPIWGLFKLILLGSLAYKTESSQKCFPPRQCQCVSHAVLLNLLYVPSTTIAVLRGGHGLTIPELTREHKGTQASPKVPPQKQLFLRQT